jgi:hypothetical protein
MDEMLLDIMGVDRMVMLMERGRQPKKMFEASRLDPL